jgi:hypothetical protein
MKAKRKRMFFFFTQVGSIEDEPMPAGRPGKMGQLAAGRAAAVAAVALCVCVALPSSSSIHDDTDELYLSVPF